MQNIWTAEGSRKYLSPSELRDFIKETKRYDPRLGTFCSFLAQSGCRISEALSITPRQFDFENSRVIVESLKKRRNGVFREVPIPVELGIQVENYCATHGIRGDEKIWTFSRMTAYRHVCLIMEQMGLSGASASPKGLRHGFAIEAIQSGVPLNIVQRWLGHASMTTTAIYASATGPEERKLADLMWGGNEGLASQNLNKVRKADLDRHDFVRIHPT